jgi:hypothetical protein
MPVKSMLIGNIHGELPTVQESFATQIGSAPLLLGDLTNLTAADQRWYHEKAAWFKKLRSGTGVVALFRNHCNATTVSVPLPFLPEGRFKLHSVSYQHLGTPTKRDWVRDVRINFSASDAVEILEVTHAT